MKLILTNNKSKLEGPVRVLLKLRDHPLFAIRVKGAFFSTAFQRGHWDGYIRFITERGYLDTGKVPQLIVELDKMGHEVEIVDNRDDILEAGKIPRRIGTWIIREYQWYALKAIKYNKVNRVPFPRGIIGAATNAGKTLLACGVYKMYEEKTLFLINSKELLEQALEEIPQIIPGKVGYFASSVGEKWNDFMIVMVQTAISRIEIIGPKLAQFKVVLVDECDLATSNTWKTVLAHTFNSFVRIGLSGSAMADARKKDKNERLRGIFGDIIYQIKNKELIEKGFSSKIKVTIFNGNTIVKEPGDYNKEYEKGIISSTERNKKIIGRAVYHYEQGRKPVLVITKNHRHVEKLFRRLSKRNVMKNLGMRIAWVHHKNENRKQVVKDFKDGKIDILVGSYILKRGKNFPLMQAVVNAGGGDSIATVLQILGRATRKHASKEYTFMDDFYDKGKYLRRHSLHRFQTYKNEGIEILDTVDKKLL